MKTKTNSALVHLSKEQQSIVVLRKRYSNRGKKCITVYSQVLSENLEAVLCLPMSVPLPANHLFPPSASGVALWSKHRTLYVDGSFTSFQQLVEKHSVQEDHLLATSRPAAELNPDTSSG